MKHLPLTTEVQQVLNALCNAALKGFGLEAYAIVKQIEQMIQSSVDRPEGE